MSARLPPAQRLAHLAKQPRIHRWLSLVCGLIGGLFVSRVIAESSAGPWPARWLGLLVCVCAAFGAALGYWLGRKIKLAPLLALAIYLFWPAVQANIASGLAGFTAFLLLMYNTPARPRGSALAWLVFAASLALYTATLAPDVLPADAGEFQLASAVLGIAHPPGYAFYTLLGKLFTLLPFGSAAFKVNWMSAAFSAATLALLCRTLERRTGSRAAALVGVLFLGLSPTFWVQSTTANIRSLTVLLTMLSLSWLLDWSVDQRPRSLALFAMAFGLGVGHHASVALLGMPYLAYIICTAPRLIAQPKRWLPALGAFAASLLVLLYLPLRSAMQPAFDPAPIRTWSDFWGHVLALGFKGDLLYFRSLPELAARLSIGGQILTLQFGTCLAILAGLALIPLALRKWKTAVLLGGVLLTNGLAAITYRAPQTVEYLLPAYLSLALILGMGLAELGRWVKARFAWRTAAAVILVLACINGWQTSRSALSAHSDDSTRIQAAALLDAAPQDAVILANWHQATPLWYLQTVEGYRPDVTIEYVYPQGATPNETAWLGRIAAWIGERPVLVTNWFYGYTASPYSFTPLEDAWLVSSGTEDTLPAGLEPAMTLFTGAVQLTGIKLEPSPDAAERRMTVTLAWQSTEQQAQDLTSFVQVLGPEGVIGQSDEAHTAAQLQPGKLQVDRFDLALLPQALPGKYQVIAGFYTYQDGALQHLTSQGQDTIVLGEYELQPAAVAEPVVHQQPMTWENGLHLTGFDVDDSTDGQRRIYLLLEQLPSSSLDKVAPERGSEECQMQALADGQVLASKTLPALAEGSYQLVALDLPAGTQHITLKVISAEGAPLAALGAWHRTTQGEVHFALPAGKETYIPLAGGIALVGVEAGDTAVNPSETIALQAHFLAAQPITRDYSVSLGLRAASGWEAKDDGTPALGAIPTLKWGWNWQIADKHLLELPADAPAGDASITVELYDAFTLRSLTVLDERRVREGQGTRLQMNSVNIE